MSTTTAGAIIASAMAKLSLIGAAATPGGNDLAFCLRALNMRCASMNLGPSFAYTRLETVYALAAVSSVTIGPGAQIDIPRPNRIELESFTRLSGLDAPLEPVDREAYNAIALKTQGGARPTVCFFDGGNPTGRLYFAPVAACEVHLITDVSVGAFADVTTTYTLPDGYEELLVYDLAEAIAPDFETEASDAVLKRAASLRRQVKRINLQVPELGVGPRRVDPKAAFLGG